MSKQEIGEQIDELNDLISQAANLAKEIKREHDVLPNIGESGVKQLASLAYNIQNIVGDQERLYSLVYLID